MPEQAHAGYLAMLRQDEREWLKSLEHGPRTAVSRVQKPHLTIQSLLGSTTPRPNGRGRSRCGFEQHRGTEPAAVIRW